MTRDLPTLKDAKAAAKALRVKLKADGKAISHAEALERTAHAFGLADWNTLHAAIAEKAPEGWSPGGRVAGTYLSKPFAATVLSAEAIRPGWFRLVLDLDTPVDVVAFDSFSNIRKRITVELGPDGHTREKTSDGEPHARVEM